VNTMLARGARRRRVERKKRDVWATTGREGGLHKCKQVTEKSSIRIETHTRKNFPRGGKLGPDLRAAGADGGLEEEKMDRTESQKSMVKVPGTQRPRRPSSDTGRQKKPADPSHFTKLVPK